MLVETVLAKDYHAFHVHAPMEWWRRMLNEEGITWGRGRTWALDAFEEKLERENCAKPEEKPAEMRAFLVVLFYSKD
jgi:hypothetical protein